MTDEKLELGVIVGVQESADAAMAKVAKLGLPTCQISWPAENSLEAGQKLKSAADGSPPHCGGFNIVFLDGYTRWLDEATFRELMTGGR